jgi:hypothetical protein
MASRLAATTKACGTTGIRATSGPSTGRRSRAGAVSSVSSGTTSPEGVAISVRRGGGAATGVITSGRSPASARPSSETSPARTEETGPDAWAGMGAPWLPARLSSTAAKSPAATPSPAGDVAAPGNRPAVAGARIWATSRLKAKRPGRMNLPTKGAPAAPHDFAVHVATFAPTRGHGFNPLIYMKKDTLPPRAGRSGGADFAGRNPAGPGQSCRPGRGLRRLGRNTFNAGPGLATSQVSQGGCRTHRVEMKGFFRRPRAGATY